LGKNIDEENGDELRKSILDNGSEWDDDKWYIDTDEGVGDR